MGATSRVLLCTGNAHKVTELAALLAGTAEVVTPRQLGWALDVAETAKTFEGNALLKAAEGSRRSGLVTVADDSGLCVEALDGLPGVHSSRFASDHGRGSGDADNNALLLERLAGVPMRKRDAFFVSVIAVMAPGAEPATFRGQLHGRIAEQARGTHGFGYDPLFLLPDGRHLAELSEEDKNALSHRGRALQAARPHLGAVLGETLMTARKTATTPPPARKKQARKSRPAAAVPESSATTPTTLAPRGGKSVNGVSPSGFMIMPNFMRADDYEARRSRPAFLNVIQAHPAPCNGCHGNCCKARVVLNVCDLVRLAGPLAVHPSSLCDLTECDSRNGEPILIGDTPRHIVLRKGEDELCALLLNVDGQKKCGVHALRPAICRIYPFSYLRGATVYQMGHVVCPKQWVLDMERANRVLDDIEGHEQDRAMDRRIVRKWNELPEERRNPTAFWSFAMKEAGLALGQDVDFMFEEVPRQRLRERLW